MIEIKVTRGDESRVHHFEEPPIRIGRSDDNDLVLSSPACSRHHAEIIQEGTTYKIKDLGSANGIMLDSKSLTEVILVDGRTVEIGEHELTFSLTEDSNEKTMLLDRSKAPAAGPVETEAPAELSVLYLVSRGGGQAQSLKVVQGVEYVIGRAPDADLCLDDRKSSAHHALIFSKAGRFSIRDTGSSNGTVVNGKKIDETPLDAGDEILIGDTVITLERQRQELSDEALLLKGTMVGSPSMQLEPALANEGAVIERTKKGAGIGLVFGLAAGVLIAVGAFVVLGGRGGDTDEAIVPDRTTNTDSSGAGPGELIVQVTSVEAKELVRSVEGSGTVRPRREVTVSTEVPGRIVELPVEEGSVVERGKLLARINDTDIRLKIDEARSAVSQDRVDLARDDYERKQSLSEDGVIARAIVDQAKHHYLSLDSQYNSTQAKIRQLEEQLRKTRITAPISGRVAKVFMNQGEVLAQGMPLATLENMEEILVELELSDRDMVKIQKGQPVEASTDAFGGKLFLGVVENIASAANPVTRTFKVEARIGNRDRSLRSGMIVSLRIVLEKSRGLAIPTEALIDRRGDEADVFVVTGGTAHKVTVQLGGVLDREVEVIAGLSEGDDIIVYGKEQVRDGQPIESYQRQ